MIQWDRCIRSLKFVILSHLILSHLIIREYSAHQLELGYAHVRLKNLYCTKLLKDPNAESMYPFLA